MLNRLIISAPFGNYFHVPSVTSTLGTFTRYARRTDQNTHNQLFWWAGMAWRAARTIRFRKRLGGWTNRMGLRNPGIDRIRYKYRRAINFGGNFSQRMHNSIVSVHGFDLNQWQDLCEAVCGFAPQAIELNFSCPNVRGGSPATDQAISYALHVVHLAKLFCSDRMYVIAKLPPIDTLAWATALYDYYPEIVLHCCNTVPCEHGGLSGAAVLLRALPAVASIKAKFPNVRVIGGGGVTTVDDVRRYWDAGADHVAVASMLFRPSRWKLLPVFRDYLLERSDANRTEDSRTQPAGS